MSKDKELSEQGQQLCKEIVHLINESNEETAVKASVVFHILVSMIRLCENQKECVTFVIGQLAKTFMIKDEE